MYEQIWGMSQTSMVGSCSRAKNGVPNRLHFGLFSDCFGQECHSPAWQGACIQERMGYQTSFCSACGADHGRGVRRSCALAGNRLGGACGVGAVGRSAVGRSGHETPVAARERGSNGRRGSAGTMAPERPERPLERLLGIPTILVGYPETRSNGRRGSVGRSVACSAVRPLERPYGTPTGPASSPRGAAPNGCGHDETPRPVGRGVSGL